MELDYSFYNRHPVKVAKDLLGKTLSFGNLKGLIAETEAYRGIDDEASHAFRGMTKRTAIMFGPPGHVYVYMIYGMYYCMNIVTEEVGQASAVLIRGLILPDLYLNGPGKLCRHLGITKEHNGINVIKNDINLYIAEGIEIKKPLITRRIGIKKAIDKPWRFLIPSPQINREEGVKLH